MKDNFELGTGKNKVLLQCQYCKTVFERSILKTMSAVDIDAELNKHLFTEKTEVLGTPKGHFCCPVHHKEGTAVRLYKSPATIKKTADGKAQRV